MAIRIRTKIIASFSGIFIILSFLSLVAIYNRNLLLKGIFKLEEELYETYVIADLQLDIDRVVMPPNDYLITRNIAEREKFYAIVEKVEEGFEQIGGLRHRENDVSIKEAKEKFATLKEKAEDIFAIPIPIGNRRGARLMQEMDALASDIVTNNLNQVHKAVRTEVVQLLDFIDTTRGRVDMFMLIGILVSIMTVCLLIIYLHRSILKPILQFKEGAFIIGGGDLNYRIDIRDGLEINLLAEEFNRMANRLKESYTDLEKKVEERTKELNELNIKLKELSITDGLTGVYNHRHFYERLIEEIKRADRYSRPLSLIITDIDYFKQYNDINGHLEGDNALKGVASCIMKNVREQDLVARYGGEEFSIILPEIGKKEAMIVGERIREFLLEQTFLNEKKQPGGKLTLSLGIAAFPEDAHDPEKLIQRADEALYRAKEKGRNRSEMAVREGVSISFS